MLLRDSESIDWPAFALFAHVTEAIIRCKECLLSEWFCAECDQLVHKRHTLHSRQTTINDFYKYIPPTEFVKLHDDKYIICEQGWCLFFSSFAFFHQHTTLLND